MFRSLSMTHCSYNVQITHSQQEAMARSPSSFNGAPFQWTYCSGKPGPPDFKIRALKCAAAAEVTRAACSNQQLRVSNSSRYRTEAISKSHAALVNLFPTAATKSRVIQKRNSKSG